MKNSSTRFPDLDRLRSLLDYDADTGIFTWRVNRGGAVRQGDTAGTVDGKGYVRVRIDALDYRAHRLAWLTHFGAPPLEEIDHINRDKTDNRICNLRNADRTQNVLNRGKQRNNTSGCTGVNWRKDVEKWTASISTGKKQRHLGYFDDMLSAIAARKFAETALRG